MRAITSAMRIEDVDAPVAGASFGPGLVADVVVRLTRVGVGARDKLKGTARIPGHEGVGVVEDAPDPKLVGMRVVLESDVPCASCERCRSGLSAHCGSMSRLGLDVDGCFAERIAVPRHAVVPIPDSIDDDGAVFAQPLSCAARLANMTHVESASYVTLIGDDVVTLLAAQLMAARNARVRVLGTSSFTIAEKWGVKHRHLHEVGLRADQDVVIVSDPGAMERGISMARPRATVIASCDGAVDVATLRAHELTLRGASGGVVREGLRALRDVDVLSLIAKRTKFDASFASSIMEPVASGKVIAEM